MDASIKQLAHLILRDHCSRGVGKIATARGSERCCEIVSLKTVTSYTHKTSAASLPKHQLNKDNKSRHIKVDEGKPRRSYTNNCRQQINAENGINRISW